MIKIFNYNYTLLKKASSEMGGDSGYIKTDTQEIVISNDLCEQATISTILHEIIEAINTHLDLNLDHSKIVSLETGLFSILTENKIDLSRLLSFD